MLRFFLGKQFILLGLVSLTVACSPVAALEPYAPLNSGYAEHQPALSGNSRYLGFVSDRMGGQQIFVYDLEQQRFLKLPGLNQPHGVMDSPSLSATGRYIAYLVSLQDGKPEVYLYDQATRRSQSLTHSYLGEVRNPDISPDGRYVVFEGTQAGRWDIEVLDRGPNVELDAP